MGLSLRGTTSGAVDINAPAVAGDNTITLPDTNGAANQFYKNSGTAGIVTHSSMVEDSNGQVVIGATSTPVQFSVQNASTSYGVEVDTSNGFASGPTLRGYYRPSSTYKNLAITGAQVVFGINDVEKARIDSSGNFGIGTSSPNQRLTVGAGSGPESIVIQSGTANTGELRFTDTGSSGYQGAIVYNHPESFLSLHVNSAERMRIDSSGRLLVGLTSSTGNSSSLQISAPSAAAAEFYTARTDFYGPYIRLSKSKGTPGSEAAVVNGDELGTITFQGYDGNSSAYRLGAHIAAVVDGTPGTNDMPGRLVFATTSDGASSPTERMRIDSSGNICFDCEGIPNGTSIYGSAFEHTSNNRMELNMATSSTGGLYLIRFYNPNGNVGNIRTNGSGTSYEESSDYRLKENVIDITGAIDRVKQLSPRRFNFIADPTTIVDGFIAHEVQAFVPEAVSGEKDEVDDDGNPLMQGIDKSKLVPLLTAALQEAITKIETLETQNASFEARLTALEG